MVFFGHFLLAFAPGLLPVGQWYFFLLSGKAAVMFFFVLSGYVLCIKPLTSRNAGQIKLSLIRRWPRLVPVVLISVLASWLLYVLDLYSFHEAARLSGSVWHADWALAEKAPSLADAVLQGVFMAFFTSEFYLNTNLWTMGKEMQGSLYVFALTALLLFRRRHALMGMLLVAALLAGTSNALLPFLLGFLLAALKVANGLSLTLAWRMPALVTGLYMLGYHSAIMDYHWISYLPSWAQALCHRLMLPLGSTLILIFLLSGSVPRWMDGALGRWLGDLSFPFYVMHTIIILSFSSSLYLMAPDQLVLNLLLTLGLVILVCLPLMHLDAAWVRWLKAKTRRFVAPEPPPASH